MNNIIDLIQDFINAEYNANIACWDLDISDEEAITIGSKPSVFFHSILSFVSFGRTRGMFDDDDFRSFAPIKLSRVAKRTIFQIKRYTKFECGDAIKRIVKGDSIYRCYVSGDEESGKHKYIRSYYIADTDIGLKIVDYDHFNESENMWFNNVSNSHKVINPGNVVEIKKIEAPQKENSLKDYNADHI